MSGPNSKRTDVNTDYALPVGCCNTFLRREGAATIERLRPMVRPLLGDPEQAIAPGKLYECVGGLASLFFMAASAHRMPTAIRNGPELVAPLLWSWAGLHTRLASQPACV